MKGRAFLGALLAFALAGLFLTAASSFGSPDDPLAEAIGRFGEGKYQQAVLILRTALAQNDGNAAMYYWLARSYFEMREWEHSAANAERAIALDSGNSEYHQWLGRAYGRKAEQAGWFGGFSLAKKSRREFEEAVRLNPRNLSAQHDLIEFYFRAPGIVGGGEDKGREQIATLATLDPVEAHLARADYWWDKKKPEQAEEEFRKVLDAKPKRVDPYLEVADFYRKRGDAPHLEEAVEAAALIDASERRLDYYRGIARVLAGNRLEEAEAMLKKYLAEVPERHDLPSHDSAHEWLGRLYELQNQRAAAIEQYRKAFELNSHNRFARDALRRLGK